LRQALLKLVVCVVGIAIALAATSHRGFGVLSGAENAYAACATTDYWNVSWCIYNPHTGVTKVRMCCSTTQGTYTVTDPAGYVIKFLHTTGGGTWISAPDVRSGQSWTFYQVAATDKLGCFNSQDVNIWINCRRANA
jgi:hypothetical protein